MKNLLIVFSLTILGCTTAPLTEVSDIHRITIDGDATASIFCETGEMIGCGVTHHGAEPHWYGVGVGGASWELSDGLDGCPVSGASKVVLWCSEPTRVVIIVSEGSPEIGTSVCDAPNC